MKTAVDKVSKGKGRVVNARFAVMCAHYLFDADFCNVASGWEKGVVEKNVQDSRRRIWLEAQSRRFGSFAELNAWLGERCRSLWGELRHPEHKAFSVAEMLDLECAEMMPVPTPFDGYVERLARVSSTCLVSVHRNRYSVPCELAGQRVSTRLYPNRVGIVAGDAVVAIHDRLPERGQVCYDWQHYIALVERKPGALRNGAPFADMPAPLKQLKLGLMLHVGGDRVMAQVLAAVPTAGLDAVLVAVELVIESGALSAEHVLNVLARLNASPPPACVETSLKLKEVPLANTNRYDSLRSTDEVMVDAEVKPGRWRLAVPPALQALRAHQCDHHHEPELLRMVQRVWRRQDDHGVAGSTNPSLPYRGDRQRFVSVPAQQRGSQVTHQVSGAKAQRWQRGGASRGALLSGRALANPLRATPFATWPAHHAV